MNHSLTSVNPSAEIVAFPQSDSRVRLAPASVGDLFYAAVTALYESGAIRSPAQLAAAVGKLLTAARRPGQRVSVRDVAALSGCGETVCKAMLKSGALAPYLDEISPAKPGRPAAVALRGVAPLLGSAGERARREAEQTSALGDQEEEQTSAASAQVLRYSSSKESSKYNNKLSARERTREASPENVAIAEQVAQILGVRQGSTSARNWLDGGAIVAAWREGGYSPTDILEAAQRCAAWLRQRGKPTDCAPGFVATRLEWMRADDECEEPTVELTEEERAELVRTITRLDAEQRGDAS